MGARRGLGYASGVTVSTGFTSLDGAAFASPGPVAVTGMATAGIGGTSAAG